MEPLISRNENLHQVSNERHSAEWSAPAYQAGATLVVMTAPFLPIIPLTVIFLVTDPLCLQSTIASDELPRSLKIPLVSRERIPISRVLAHPDQYQMREIRLTGIVTALQTEVILDWRTCGFAYERTTLMVEDDSGAIELIDMGACGRNMSALKAPMLKVGEQIDLLVHIRVATNQESREATLEATIRFLDRARY